MGQGPIVDQRIRRPTLMLADCVCFMTLTEEFHKLKMEGNLKLNETWNGIKCGIKLEEEINKTPSWSFGNVSDVNLFGQGRKPGGTIWTLKTPTAFENQKEYVTSIFSICTVQLLLRHTEHRWVHPECKGVKLESSTTVIPLTRPAGCHAILGQIVRELEPHSEDTPGQAQGGNAQQQVLAGSWDSVCRSQWRILPGQWASINLRCPTCGTRALWGCLTYLMRPSRGECVISVTGFFFTADIYRNVQKPITNYWTYNYLGNHKQQIKFRVYCERI